MTDTITPFPGLQSTVLEEGTTLGVDWQVHMGPLTINGYVRLPEGHRWVGQDLTFGPHAPEVHGGITFNEGNIIGFDTGHLGDGFHPDARLYDPLSAEVAGGRVWSADAVRRECLRLAEQVVSAQRVGQ